MTVVAAVIVAAGRGQRVSGEVPKQYRLLDGSSAIRSSLALFVSHPRVGRVQAVIHPDDLQRFSEATKGLALPDPVFGGATRQASVHAGLKALSLQPPDIVLVHDAARPFASSGLVGRAVAAAERSGAAIPALPVTDTVKHVDDRGNIVETLDRAALRIVQTPQAFAFEKLLDAHRRAAAAGRDNFSDDAALAEWAGLQVTEFPGEPGNIKLTTDDDFLRAQAALAAASDIRTGTGYDIHAFVDGDHVTLGGVRIAHDRELAGHSDADVVLHAIVDAILGALAEADIGAHFSPSDPQWRGVASDRFLAFAVERVRARGGRIAHIDVTIVCEAPKIGPHRDAIRARIAQIAQVPVDRVAVKATTNEGLGAIGRGEGIAALATATMRLPWRGSDA
jgi:2-C-methyl-D-erythritol 4-phosphate cytidylyltransferase/2-C-methyl-D-erythritol 2,4-cyclodiphosphate synthase